MAGSTIGSGSCGESGEAGAKRGRGALLAALIDRVRRGSPSRRIPEPPHRRRPILEALEERLLLSADIAAQIAPTISWAGDASGFWDVAANWRDANGIARVPTSTDDVLIDRGAAAPVVTIRANATARSLFAAEALTLASGTLTVGAASEIDGALSIAGGTLRANASLTLAGSTTVTSGRIDGGSGGVTNVGTITLSPGTGQVFLGGSVSNAGTVIHSGAGTLALDVDSRVTNLASGLYDFQGNGVLNSGGNIQAVPNFVNQGVIRKSSGTGTATITGGAFSNDGGTIDVQSGNLTLANRGGVSAGGTFKVAAGSIVDLTSPSSSDTVTYKGTYTATGQGTIRLAGSTLAAGIGGVTFDFPTGMFQWTGGNLNGTAGAITNAGWMSLAGANTKYLGGTLANAGTMVHGGTGTLQLDYAVPNGPAYVGTLNNNGVYDLEGDLTAFARNFAGNSAFNNNATGTFRKSAGIGIATTSNIPFNNRGGTIDVDAGTFTINSGGTHTGGTFDVATGGTLRLSSSNALTGTYTGSGGGVVQLNGTFNVGATGAVFDFGDPLVQWVNGAINGGAVGFTNAGTMRVIAGGTPYFGGTANNVGRLIVDGNAALSVSSNSTLTNQSGGVIEFTGNGALGNLANSAPTLGLVNRGSILKSGGTTSTIQVNGFDFSLGTVDVLAGTLFLSGQPTTVGRINVAAGAVVELSGGVAGGNGIPYSGTLTGSGGGTVRIAGGSIASGSAGLTFNLPAGMLQWTGGLLDGTLGGGFVNAGWMTIAGAGAKTLVGAFRNAGTIVHTGGNLNLDFVAGTAPPRSGTLTNDTSGVYDLKADVTFLLPSNTSSTFVNRGVFQKTAGVGTTTFNQVRMNNTGTVEVGSGTLALNALVTQLSSGVLSGGTWKVGPNSSLTLPGAITNNQGTVVLDGVGSTLNAISGLAANSGVLAFLNGRSFTTTAGFNNTGTLRLGSGSLFTVNGAYTQSSAGRLETQLAGRPGTNLFGRLTSTANATLNGTFAVSLLGGFGPTQGDAYQVMAFPTRSGGFTTYEGLTLGRFTLFEADLAANKLTLNGLTTGADLAVGNLELLGTTASPGESVSVRYTVSNQGGTPANGDWYDSIYLSTNEFLDAGDTLLGRILHTGGVDALSSYTETLTASLPPLIDRGYRLIVTADSRGLVPDANRNNNTVASTGVLAVTIPQIPLGGEASGTIRDGEERYFKVVLQPGEDLVLGATMGPDAGADLFIRFGGIATRSAFDSSTAVGGDPDELRIGNAQSGEYYVLLRGREGAGSGASFTLSARAARFEISAVTPTELLIGQPAVIRLVGAKFTPRTAVSLVAADGTSYAATEVELRDSATLSARFDLSQVPAGAYSVRAVDGDRASTAPEIVEVVSAIVRGYPLRPIILSPAEVRVGAPIPVTVKVINGTEAWVPLPFVQVTATNVQPGQERQQFADPSSPAFAPPDTVWSIDTSYGPKPAVANTVSSFNLAVIDLATPIDWNGQKARSKPEGVPDEAWEAIWLNFRQRVGSTVGDLYALMKNDGYALQQNGSTLASIEDLIHFELRKANNETPFPSLVAGVDVGVQGPGLPLVFARSYQSSILGRYSTGDLGRGWVHNFEISVAVDAEGLATVAQGGVRRYFAQRPDGSFIASPGDTAVLARNAGKLELREQGGLVTVFRPDGKLDSLQDAQGNKIVATYASGRLSRLDHSSGGFLALSYDASGRLATVADSAGRTAAYTHDAKGHLLSVTTATGTTTFAYTADEVGPRAHALTSMTTPQDGGVYFAYDGQGRLRSQALENGAAAIEIAYGTASFQVTDALGRVAEYYTDASGRVVATKDPLQRIGAVAYNARGQVSALGVAGSGRASVEYDALGNLVRTTDAAGAVADFSVDPATGRLVEWRDAMGNSTRYTYDAKGNLLSTTLADGSSEQYAYDARGNVVKIVDRRGQATTYVYDARGLLLSVTAADGSQTTYTYDARGNLASAANAQGTITLQYDAADRVTRVGYPGGRFLLYAYDADGRVAERADQSGFALRYAYDALGRLSRLSTGADEPIASYAYDGAGRIAREEAGNGTYTTYEYDAAGQLLAIVNHAPGGQINSQYVYAYDSAGRRASVTTAEGTTQYGYDATGRLASVALPGGRTIVYQYDAAGNRTAVLDGSTATGYASDSLNRYVEVGGNPFSYDRAGNQTSGAVGGERVAYAYDARDRLVAIVDSTGTRKFEYDAFGNRTAVVYNGVRTEYLSDPFGNVVAEYGGTGQLVARYAHGLWLESRIEADGDAAYYEFDAVGSTTGMTGAGGGYLNTYSYLPFGERLSAIERIDNPFEFNGAFGVRESGAGLYSMRAREYDPSVGRFTQADPAGLLGGLNAYAFVDNNPVDANDPAGLVSPLAFTLGGISPLATTLPGVSPLATTLPGISPLATTLTGQTIGSAATGNALGSTLPGLGQNIARLGLNYSQFASQVEAAAYAARPIGAQNITHLNLNYAQFAAQVEAAKAQMARQAMLKVGARAGLWGLLALEAAVIGYSLGSIWYAEDYRAANNGRLPPCPDDNPAWLNFVTACDDTPILDGNLVSSSSTIQIGPKDPNFIAGPGGFGPQNYVVGEATWPYFIGFENKADATAPAQEVFITQQLDADLDLATFALGDFGFGDIVVDVPDGRQYYSTRVDAIASRGVYVDVTAELDVPTRTVKWTFSSIDPNTLDLPSNPRAGFLPPNVTAPEGDGFVTYYVSPKAALASGTVVEAQASIVFDTEAALLTNVFINTIDADPPSSSVDPLPAVEYAESITVSWSGGDGAGSGIATYDVYVSDDGRPAEPFLLGTTLTSAAFSGQFGHTYSFFSVAADNVGRREGDPAAPDAVVQLVKPNEAPSALDDAAATTEDTAVDVDVVANDTDPEGAALTLVSVSAPLHGSAVIVGNAVRYTPNPDYFGPDGFGYTVVDPSGARSSASVALSVAPVNDAPVARGDAYQGVEDLPLAVGWVDGVLANDSDVDSPELAARVLAGPRHGTLHLNADGSFTYVAQANYSGPDAFTYFASDGLLASDVVTVSLFMASANDAPVASSDGFSVDEDGRLVVPARGVLNNDFDEEGAMLAAQLVEGPQHGTLTLNADGSFVYTPAPDYFGPDAFAYLASDGTENSNVATVSLSVDPVNDAPVAANDTAATSEGTPIAIAVLGNDADVEGDVLTPVLVDGPMNGTAAVNADGRMTYTPTAGFAGRDAFTYRVSDGDKLSNLAVVEVSVAPVNAPPVAVDDAYVTPANAPLNLAAPGVLANDVDPDGDALAVIAFTQGAHGIVSIAKDGALNYTPNADYVGSDAFTYTVADGALASVATVRVTVEAVNTAPQAFDDLFTLREDGVLMVAAPGVLENDFDDDGDPLVALIADGPMHGALSIAVDGSFVYTPVAGFNGEDSFSYRARDAAGGLSRIAQVRLVIQAVNEAPVFTSTPPAAIEIGGRAEVGGDAVLYVAETVTLTFKFDTTKAAFRNELGVYRVDDAAGRVAGLAPGDAGYVEKALAPGNFQVLFERGERQGERSTLTLEGTGHYAFYLVQDATTVSLLAGNPGNAAHGKPIAFFSVSSANAGQFDNLRASMRDGRLTLAWEDIAGGGDRDFNDAVVSAKLPQGARLAFVQPAGALLPLETFVSGESGDGVFEVPAGNGLPIQAAFAWGARQAAYKGEFGIYRVDDASGRIGTLRPGDAGYAKAAVARGIALFGRESETGDRTSVNVQAGGFYAFYLVQNATSGDFLGRNPANSLKARPIVFFSVQPANPDGFDHMRGSIVDGRLALAWEDMVRGGDGDFDDARVLVELRQSAPAVFSYRATAVDADGDTLRYSVVSGPEGTTIDPQSGLLTWAPLPGRFDFVIRADDGRGGVTDQRFTLDVHAVAQAPVFDWSGGAQKPSSRPGAGWWDDFVCRLGQKDDEWNPNRKTKLDAPPPLKKSSAGERTRGWGAALGL